MASDNKDEIIKRIAPHLQAYDTAKATLNRAIADEFAELVVRAVYPVYSDRIRERIGNKVFEALESEI